MKNFVKIISLTLTIIILMSTVSFAKTLYAPDGRTINVADNEVIAYLSVGWYEHPVTTMYSSDGRSINVYLTDVAKWESVGWIDGRKTTTIYAPDGRTAVIPLWQLQSYLNQGWYDYPVSNNHNNYYSGTNIPRYEDVAYGTLEFSDYDQGVYTYVYQTDSDWALYYITKLISWGWSCEGSEYDSEYDYTSLLFKYDDRTLVIYYYYTDADILIAYNN